MEEWVKLMKDNSHWCFTASKLARVLSNAVSPWFLGTEHLGYMSHPHSRFPSCLPRSSLSILLYCKVVHCLLALVSRPVSHHKTVLEPPPHSTRQDERNLHGALPPTSKLLWLLETIYTSTAPSCPSISQIIMFGVSRIPRGRGT